MERVTEVLRELGVPGVVAEAVTESGVHRARSGVADIQAATPMPYDGHFRIASITKVFTATVLLQLAGQDKLSLDDPVDRWLPGVLGPAGQDLTVRDLLQHTTGLPEYGSQFPIHSAADFERECLRTYQPDELVELALCQLPRGETPRREWLYSNTNYILAGMLIERVTGRTWAREVTDRIVHPLGLRHTSAPETSPDLPAPHARSYFRFGLDAPRTDTTFFNPSMVWSAGSLISTTADLNRFAQALVRGELLPPTQQAEMQRTLPARDDVYGEYDYGLGLMRRPLNNGSGFWGHVGDGVSFASRMGVALDGRRSLVVVMTSEMLDPETRAQQEAAVNDLFERVLG